MDIINPLTQDWVKVKAAVFDFDGTLSTLRYGWESVMEPFMIEAIEGDTPADDELVKEVRNYIDESTGIQTIFQMQWLVEAIKRYRRNPEVKDDPWWYKNEYNKRLMISVNKRKQSILSGRKSPKDYLIRGSEAFLNRLKGNGVEIYVASGTDFPDVLNEVEVLKLKKYFKEIKGAPLGVAACSKEAVLKKLVEDNKLKGQEVVVVGDGKVEINLGNQIGAKTIGVASNEEKLYGVNPVKEKRLIKAGANIIVGDFTNIEGIIGWLNLK